MTAPIPDPLLDLFEGPALAHVGYTTLSGAIVIFPMWVDRDGEHVLVSSAVGSKKGRALRERPRVGVEIVSPEDPWRWLSISGRVVGIEPDEDLAFIDRMSRKYTGRAYARRSPREIFIVEPDRVRSSPGRRG